MNLSDFKKLTGAEDDAADYLPVACMLSTGYGCAGYFSPDLNEDMEDTCVLLNARLVDLRHGDSQRGRVSDFNDFIEDIVSQHYRQNESHKLPETELSGSSIPLMAIPFREITLVYPVAHIASLMRRTQQQLQPAAASTGLPSFLDFDNKSIVVQVLRTKLW